MGLTLLLTWVIFTLFGHHLDLYPFRMTIDNDQEHFPHEWPCEIGLNSLPWHRRPIVPVGACFVTFDNRYIAERSLLYLYQDWATRREVERGISFGRSLDALCVTRVTLVLGVA